MSQCTHIIVFNSTESTDLPSEILSYSQLRVVGEAWLSACIKNHKLLDETPYLIQSVNNQTGMLE